MESFGSKPSYPVFFSYFIGFDMFWTVFNVCLMVFVIIYIIIYIYRFPDLAPFPI